VPQSSNGKLDLLWRARRARAFDNESDIIGNLLRKKNLRKNAVYLRSGNESCAVSLQNIKDEI
jgi:hypothetical protein